MMLKNYCVIIMGDTLGAKNEIQSISESQINFLDAKGIIIATFSTNIKLDVMHDHFQRNKRSFFIFELNEKTSSVHIMKKEIHEGLFGFISKEITEDVHNFLIETIMSSDTNTTQAKYKITKTTIENLSPQQKEDLLNQLIDNGLEKLTEEEKELLPLLINNKTK